MSPRAFSLLLVATIICVAGAIWAVGSREQAVATTSIDEPLFADLGGAIDTIGRVVVDTGGETTTAILSDGQWLIEEKNGYPADPKPLRELVLGLADTRLVEAKTANPERYSRLDLGDPGSEGSASQSVMIADRDGETIASVIIGKKKFGLFGAGRAGNYVRRGDEAETWLADRSFDLPVQAIDWLDQAIIDLPRGDILSVTLRSDVDDQVVIEANDTSEEFDLANVPEGEGADFEKLRRTAGTLSNLAMVDVRQVGDVDFSDGVSTARYATKQGLIIDVDVVSEASGEDTQYWIKLAASEGDPIEQEPVENEGEEIEPALSLPEQVDQYNEKYGPWAFEISDYLAERLLYRTENLLANDDPSAS